MNRWRDPASGAVLSRCSQEPSPEIKSKIQLRWEDDRAKIRSKNDDALNGEERERKKETKEENGWNEDFSKI